MNDQIVISGSDERHLSTVSILNLAKVLFTAIVLLIAAPAFPATSIGVPTPPLDPDMPAPEGPPAWPSSEAAGYYYVDNSSQSATDQNNPFGFPDRPRQTIPTGTFSAGSYVEVHGGPYDPASRIEIASSGTAQRPVWIVGKTSNGTTLRSELRLSGSFLVIENFRFDQSRKTINVSAGSSNILIRENILSGPGINDGNTSAIGLSGKSAAENVNIILYRNQISGFGDTNPQSAENDYHGIKGSRYCSDIWILENHIFDMSGDSVQFGEASLPDNERCHHVYIARNNFHDNRENAVDIKNSQDIVISENRMSGFIASGSSGGTAMVVHNGADNVWIFGNTIFDSELGFANTGGTNVWLIANRISQIRSGSGNFDANSYYGDGVAIHFRGESSGGILYNTLYGNDKGIQITGGQNYRIIGNIFADRLRQDSFDVMFQSTSLRENTAITDNLFSNFGIRVSSSEFRDPNTFNQSFSGSSTSIEGDPLFESVVANDFRLRTGSPAIDAGSEPAAFSEFRARYGLALTYDLDGQQRPNMNNWDLGAFEAPAGPVPDSPKDLN